MKRHTKDGRSPKLNSDGFLILEIRRRGANANSANTILTKSLECAVEILKHVPDAVIRMGDSPSNHFRSSKLFVDGVPLK